jgi:hypothetical protein
VEYIISAKEQYINIYDIVYAQIHLNLCKETGVKLENKHWYEHVLSCYVTCNIPGKHEIKEAQKAATLGAAHKLQIVLM